MQQKHLVIIILFHYLASTAQAQNIAKYTDSINKVQIENLALLGKIWGLLKYHHPNIAKGNYDWDSELFTILPAILEVDNAHKRDKIFEEWVDKIGHLPKNNLKDCEIDSNIKQKADYSWINTQELNSELATKLLNIKNHIDTSNNFYVSLWESGANPLFTNEKMYETDIYPSLDKRLLCLYRFWNIVQYFYPYKYAIVERNWNDVLKDMIPRFVNAQSDVEYRNAILTLLESVHDSHTTLHKDPMKSKIEGVYKPKVKLSFIDNKPVVIRVSNKESQLKVGDIIVQKKGENIDSILAQMLPLTPGSNNSAKFRDISKHLLSSKDNLLDLTILRNDSLLEIIEPLYNDPPIIFPVPKYNHLIFNENIGYIYLGNINANEFANIFEQFKQTKGIVLDLRNYPQLNMEELNTLGEYLIPQPIEFVLFTNTSVNCKGLFHYDYTLKIGKEQTHYYKGIVVILVNEITQSKAELFAMALSKAPRAIVMGSQTAGADGPVSTFALPGGYVTGITGRGVYYPDKKETQRVGIVPDIEVKPSLNGIKGNKDEVLQMAIKYINEN